jgi:hypothetical protein
MSDQEILRELEAEIRKAGFLSSVKSLSETEQLVLRTFLKHNVAMATKTVRAELINDLALQHLTEIEDYADAQANGPTTIKTSIFTMNATIKKELAGKGLFFKLITPRTDLIKRGITPLSPTERAFILEWILKKGLSIGVPAWETVQSALKRLTDGKWIKKQSIEGKKSDAEYYVSDLLFELWSKENERLRNTSKKSAVEKFWFG